MPSKVRLDFVFWHKLIFGHFLATGPASLTKLLEIHALNFDQLNLSSFACQFNISVKSDTNFISRPHFWLCQNFPSDYNFTTILRFQKTKKKSNFLKIFQKFPRSKIPNVRTCFEHYFFQKKSPNYKGEKTRQSVFTFQLRSVDLTSIWRIFSTNYFKILISLRFQNFT